MAVDMLLRYHATPPVLSWDLKKIYMLLNPYLYPKTVEIDPKLDKFSPENA